MNSNSYIQVDSTTVLKLVEERLALIKVWRQQEWSFLISEYRASRDWWKRYMPWLRDLTDEQIRQRIRSSGAYWFLPSLLGIDTEETCRKLRKAAKSAEVVFVHTEDYCKLTA